MRTSSADPTCYLIELSDLEQDPLPAQLIGDLDCVTQIVDWARDYLCQPHAELGREGPICPFVPSSLTSELFFVAVQRGRELTQQDVYDVIMKYRNWFLELEPREGREAQYKTILILFPDIPAEDAPKTIDVTQIQLKPEFVAKGLMIGQFHQLPPQDAGLWNPDFRPLRSPIPLLAIRHMVPTDFPFLTKDQRFIASYLDIYGSNIPRKHLASLKELALQFGLDLPGHEMA